MSSQPVPPLETVLANVGVPPYPVPKGRENKLKGIEVPSDEIFHLLLTYCFDAQRKLLYVCQATLPLLDRADPEFRRRVQQDSDYINESGLKWEERAKRAHEVMLRLQQELGDRLEGVLTT